MYIYMLLVEEGKKEIIVGVFSSKKKVDMCVRELSKRKSYRVFKLPLNQKIVPGKRKFNDHIEEYVSQYYGTFKEHYIKLDKNDNLVKEGVKNVEFWPE